jgi:acyl-CoA reductase-like NAD-dependent aldehyde dehydrogenase
MLASSMKETAENVIRMLRDPCLFREQAYIGGKWRSAENGRVCVVTNPSTGAVIGTVPNMGAAETRAAIDAACAATAGARGPAAPVA